MCFAALAAVICQLLRQPLIVGYLVTRVVVGPYTPGVVASTERIQLLANLGVTILIFSIGLEFRFLQLLRLTPTAGLVALIQALSNDRVRLSDGAPNGLDTVGEPGDRRDGVDFRRRHHGRSVGRGASRSESKGTCLQRGALRRRDRDPTARGAYHLGERGRVLVSHALNQRGPARFIYRSGNCDRTDDSPLHGAPGRAVQPARNALNYQRWPVLSV